MRGVAGLQRVAAQGIVQIRAAAGSETVTCVQVATVQTSYQTCFEDMQCMQENSWALLSGRKR